MLPLSSSKRLLLSALAATLLAVGACTNDNLAPNGPQENPRPDKLLAPTSYNPFSAVPVNGTWSGGTFIGTYTVLKFVVVNGKLNAEVRLKGKILTFAGAILSYVDVKLYVPVKVLNSSCTILKLELAAVVKVLVGKSITLSKCLIIVDPTKVSLVILASLKLVLCNITGALGGVLSILCGFLNQCLNLFKCGLLSCLL